MDNIEIENKNDKVFITIGVVGVILIVLFYLFVYSSNPYTRTDDISAPIVVDHKEKTDSFEKVFLTAKSAAVWDVKNQKFIYKKNEDEVLPLASLTKLMTALVASEVLPENSRIRIANQYIGNEWDPELVIDDQWKSEDLIAHTLITSSNAGANAIASVSGLLIDNPENASPKRRFIDFMNSRSKEIGLESTSFYNDSGLDLNDEKSGAYGNALDMVKLMDYVLRNHPDLLEPTTHSKLRIVTTNNLIHNIKNTNVTVDNTPGILASKTGFTDLAGGNLIVAFSPGLDGPYVAVVLGSTSDGRFTDMNQLISATIGQGRK